MKKIYFLTIVVISVAIGYGFRPDNIKDSESYSFVIPKMIAQVNKYPQLIFDISNCERIGSEILCGKQRVCLQTNPFKCRVFMIEPSEGDQIVYDSELSKKATYIPGGFPYVSMELDPLGDKMRTNNHHSIFELGFRFFSKITEHYYKRFQSTFYISKSANDGNSQYVITSVMSKFFYKKYLVKKKETARSIAHDEVVSEYLITEKNRGRKSFVAGDTILIPAYYYKKFELEINAENYFPSLIKVYDDKGLLEKYEFSKLNLDPDFKENTFKE